MAGEDGYSTSEGGSRKRIRTSRTTSRPVNNDPIIIPSESPVKAGPSVTLPIQNAETERHAQRIHDGSCQHEQSLRALNNDLEGMRQVITCKICLRFLYEPYALTCGHTYCYSCIMNWMGPEKKKTCPDCRAFIKEQPAPSFLVREMVMIFTKRNELLPDGETVEEHTQHAREEEDAVVKDRLNGDIRTGGLFRGLFKQGSRYNPVRAIRDESDHVDRCPQCLNEVEDGRCSVCNIRVATDDDESGFSDSDLDDDTDFDGELADLEAEEIQLGFDAEPPSDWDLDNSSDVNEFYANRDVSPGAYDGTGYGYSSDEEHDSDMDGFIDDGVHDDDHANVGSGEDSGSDSEGTAVEPTHRNPRSRQITVILSDSEDDGDDDDEPIVQSHNNRAVPQWTSNGTPPPGAARRPESESRNVAISNTQRNRHISDRAHGAYNPESDEDVGYDGFGENDSEHDGGPSETEVNLENHRFIHGFSSEASNSDDDEEEPSFHGHDHGYGDDHYEGGVSSMSDRLANSDDQEVEENEQDDEDEDDQSEDMQSTVDGWAPHAPAMH